mgnify:CR=1 FL=1
MKKIMITLMICILSIIGCESILNSEDDTVVYYIESIDGKDINTDSFKNNNSFYPKKFIFKKYKNFNFKGEVEVDSIGIARINNFDKNNPSIICESCFFIIDTTGSWGKSVSFILFTSLKKDKDLLQGVYQLGSETIDYFPTSFIAKRK